ncbi:unnamed protein product [Camellia sinensis]
MHTTIFDLKQEAPYTCDLCLVMRFEFRLTIFDVTQEASYMSDLSTPKKDKIRIQISRLVTLGKRASHLVDKKALKIILTAFCFGFFSVCFQK